MPKDTRTNSGKQDDSVRRAEEANAGYSPSQDSPDELLRLVEPKLLGTYFFGILSLVTAVRIAVRLTPVNLTPAGTATTALSDPFVYPLNHLIRVSPSASLEPGSVIALGLYAALTVGVWALSQGWARPVVAQEKAE